MKGITDQQGIFQRKDIEKPSSLETIGQSDCYNGGKNAFSFYQDKNYSLNDCCYHYYDAYRSGIWRNGDQEHRNAKLGTDASPSL